MAMDSMYNEGFCCLLVVVLLKPKIFVADMSSSMHIDNKNKDILILGRSSTDGLDDTTLTINGIEIYKFKGKDSEINAAPLC